LRIFTAGLVRFVQPVPDQYWQLFIDTDVELGVVENCAGPPEDSHGMMAGIDLYQTSLALN
jgi:hypothetical protein